MDSFSSTYTKKKKKRLDLLLSGITLIAFVFLIAFALNLSNSKSNEESYNTRNKIYRVKRNSARNASIIETTTGAWQSNSSLNAATGSLPKPADQQGIYPPDHFTVELRRKGAVAIHIFGLLYMFAALAIVCDEFFVPALEVITYRLSISDDVAGATFMAAGGSAPELFTSVIGVFLAKSNVGVGTIVGSAVFNILFVIGMCSLFSREILTLTWWPLFRDCSFYIISLMFLMYAFVDAAIQFYESIILIAIYLAYVTFMKYNQSIEKWVKSKLESIRSKSGSNAASKNKISPSVRAIVEAISNPQSESSTHSKNTFSYGIVQLIMHSLDPASEDDKTNVSQPNELYAIAKGAINNPRAARAFCTSPTKVVLKNGKADDVIRPLTPTTVIYDDDEGVKVITQGTPSPDPVSNNQNNASARSREIEQETNIAEYGNNTEQAKEKCLTLQANQVSSSTDEAGDALDMSWPKTNTKRCVYLVLCPIMFLLWITLPDVRKPKKEKWFMASFFGSIVWIGIFSYIMVWMAHQIGETIGISETIMGLTILAAGTSVPDLITSVIVARKGLGDMAVSSSVGSNIFDVTIGLPFPWLIKSIVTLGVPVDVSSDGLFCSLLLLFGMLLFVVLSIAFFRWKMNRKLGFVMLILYVVFLVLSLLLELSVIPCHVSV